MNKKLAWEKWYNEVEDETLKFDYEFDQDEQSINESESHMGFSPEMFYIPKKISTPFGVYEASDPLSPTNLFECWVAHSNFPICNKEYNILNDEIEGIGAFKVISKYRFFIGIEKLFNFRKIRKDIEKKLCNTDGDMANFGV